MSAEELVAYAEELSGVAAAGGAKALADHLMRHTSLAVLVEDARRQPLAQAGPRNGSPGRVLPLAGPARAPVGYLSVFGAGS